MGAELFLRAFHSEDCPPSEQLNSQQRTLALQHASERLIHNYSRLRARNSFFGLFILRTAPRPNTSLTSLHFATMAGQQRAFFLCACSPNNRICQPNVTSPKSGLRDLDSAAAASTQQGIIPITGHHFVTPHSLNKHTPETAQF